eukprot:SAG11_NODE_503_length_8890_cov_30.658628_4_plen_314_part_00
MARQLNVLRNTSSRRIAATTPTTKQPRSSPSAASGGGSLSLQSVGGSISGLAVADSSFAMDAASMATLGGTIRFENAGAVGLVEKTIVDGSLVVDAGTQLSLSGCTLNASVNPTVTGSGSLSLASMAVPVAVLAAAETLLSGADSTLRLVAVTLLELADLGPLTGIMTVDPPGLPLASLYLASDSKTVDPPGFGVQNTGNFTVTSGPCTVFDGGRCVGRPGGYWGGENCAIVVGGGGGVLGACGVFDTTNSYDHLNLPETARLRSNYGSDCPVGAALVILKTQQNQVGPGCSRASCRSTLQDTYYNEAGSQNA